MGYLIRQAQLFVFHDFNRRLAPLDLRPAQYSILSVTRENPGLSQMALSHVLGIGRSGIVPLLDVLEARGLLMRRPAADRRSHALYLTAKGSGLLARADVLVQQNQDHTIDKIGRRNHDQLLKSLDVFGRPEKGPNAGPSIGLFLCLRSTTSRAASALNGARIAPIFSIDSNGMKA